MTPEYLHECFDYKPETGQLIWKKRPLHHFLSEREWKLVNARQAGKVAGAERKRNDGIGYFYVKIAGNHYSVHSVVMAYHGSSADGRMQIDHINGNKQDNRIENLRFVTPSQNCMNSKKRSHNTSGHHGIQWRKARNKWVVRLVVGGKTHVCGHFDDISEAIIARDKALLRLGFSELHGKERGE